MRRTTSGHRLPLYRFPELRCTSEVQGERKVKLACFSEPQPSLAMHFSQMHCKDNKKYPDFPTFKKLISNLFQMLIL